MKKKDLKQGFTFVEVALVFAIAGLIFLMVFIALPTLQRSQRDAKRRDDMGTVLSAIQNYQSNNRGALPRNASDIKQFITTNFEDPSGHPYTLEISACGNGKASGMLCGIGEISNKTFPNGYTLYVVTGATCDGAKSVASNNPRKVAVVYKMEGGGAYCASLQ